MLIGICSNAVVITGILAIILLLWIERRKKFRGPDVDWEALNARNIMG